MVGTWSVLTPSVFRVFTFDSICSSSLNYSRYNSWRGKLEVNAMKSPFLNSALVSIIIAVIDMSNVARAGFIVDDQEFLELQFTRGQTVAEVASVISGNSSFAGYSLATDIDMAKLYSMALATAFTLLWFVQIRDS